MTAGLMAIYRFPYAAYTAQQLGRLCDKVYLRFDNKGDRAILDQVEAVLEQDDKLGGIIASDAEWNWHVFRQELIRTLDDVAPALVLFPDEDEVFPAAQMRADIAGFTASDKRGMMFGYHAPMPTDDGALLFDGLAYPTGRQNSRLMKAYKWQAGLTYLPYHGYTRVTNYIDPACYYTAETEILHYSHWTAELRARHKMNW